MMEKDNIYFFIVQDLKESIKDKHNKSNLSIKGKYQLLRLDKGDKYQYSLIDEFNNTVQNWIESKI